jgi:hypothetical protein
MEKGGDITKRIPWYENLRNYIVSLITNHGYFFIGSVVLLYICYWIYRFIFIQNIATDINTHVYMIVSSLDGTISPPANFLFYLTVYVASFFSTNIQKLTIVTDHVLDLSILGKYIVTYLFLYSTASISNGIKPGKRNLIITLLAFGLAFAFSFPIGSIRSGQYYLGQIPPSVWHNSTVIFLMPFAILLFWLSYQQLISPNRLRRILIISLVILNILIKPSFFFVYLLSYPILLVKAFGVKKQAFLELLPIGIGAVLLFVEFYLLFIQDPLSSGLSIHPFQVWGAYSPNIPLSILASISFPLFYTFIYWKDVKKDTLLQYAWLLFISGIIIFSLLVQNGDQESSGNFIWQCIAANYLLFMGVLSRLIPKLIHNPKPVWRQIVVSVIFALHFISGAYYISRIFIFKTLF